MQDLKDAVLREIPDVEIAVDGPNEHGFFAMDFFWQERHVVIQYLPEHGYGVSLVDENTGYGEKPDEVYPGPTDVAARVITLLRTGEKTS